MWEFQAATAGWANANIPDNDKSLSPERIEELWALVKDA